MKHGDYVLTATNEVLSCGGKTITFENEEYLTLVQVLDLFSKSGREIVEKDLRFRKDSFTIGNKAVEPEITFKKVKGSGNSSVAKLKDVQSYILNLFDLSVDLNYNDARDVVEKYDNVLLRSRKHGMRGQRNFTGKVEDEIRGKLVELGFAKYALLNSQLELPVAYDLIEDKTRKRDYGDFIHFVDSNRILNIPKEYTFSTKSTNGNFLAVPKVELDWEGEIFVLIKLHIKETFLYKAIKAGLQLGTIDFEEKLGWIEIRGFVTKADFRKAPLALNFPGKYALSSDFRQENYILAPSQLNRNYLNLLSIFKKIKGFKREI